MTRVIGTLEMLGTTADITTQAGSSGVGGQLRITTGNGDTGFAGGEIVIEPGTTTGAAAGAGVSINSADAGGSSNANGGDVSINLGEGDGTGTDGFLRVIGGSTDAGELRLEQSGGGNYAGLVAPNSVTTSYTMALPPASQTGLLGVDGSGNMFGLQEAYSESRTYQSLTATIPVDDTIPQNTEGTEILTVSITPRSTSSILEITGYVTCQASTTQYHTIALFQDSTANALESVSFAFAGSNFGNNVSIHHRVVAGSTASTTFRLRVGPASGTLYLNGASGGRQHGGVQKSYLQVREIGF